jgi:hypothetical protein
MIKELSNDEYLKLAAASLKAVGMDASGYGDAEIARAIGDCKRVHRLLADGHKVENLTPAEQVYAAVFSGMRLAKVPNDYGWEPAIEVDEVAAPAGEIQVEAEPKAAPKPKKNGR